ncbi:type IV pilus modification PilV family protein [Cupriavidus campinensis]
MSSAAPCPADPRLDGQRHPRGYILLESLICLAIVGIGAMPLAMLGPLWLRLAGEQESLGQAMQLASEHAETGGAAPAVLPGSRGARLCGAVTAGTGSQPHCAAGSRIALAGPVRNAPDIAPGTTLPPTHVALWVMP